MLDILKVRGLVRFGFVLVWWTAFHTTKASTSDKIVAIVVITVTSISDSSMIESINAKHGVAVVLEDAM
jgi:hypothetical protein